MMKQFACLVLMALFSTQAFSHAVVTDHTLKIAKVKANAAKTITLTFNSKVEIGLSQIFLVSKGDKHELLNIAKGEKQGEVYVELPALASGEYALRYKIFAADGHLTEDFIHFSVVEQAE